MDIYLASMPSMTDALTASAHEVQLTLTVYMYCWGFAQLLAGPMSDRYGRHPVLMALMTTMPQATDGALTPFPEIAGAGSSLLSFAQFVTALTAALAVGIAFDGMSRAMATVSAIGAVCAFAAFRALIARRPYKATRP